MKFKNLIVLKIGGSICTDKQNNNLKVRENILRQVAKEIKKAKSEKEFNLIVVHGAGPFGHKLVEEYGIKDGLSGKKHIRGFVETHASMERLNKKIMEIFLKEGLNVLPMQTSALVMQRNHGKPIFFYTNSIKQLMSLDTSIVPLLYGDMVFDYEKKATVISGDTVASFLAKLFGANRLIYGTNVDGIIDYSSKPKVIAKITDKNLESVFRHIKAAKTSDVTGSMKGKILQIKENAKGIKTFVYNMGKKNNTYNILVSKSLIGTEIYFV
ncbi:MAG: isopentenyl phosphate kinase [archaeon]